MERLPLIVTFLVLAGGAAWWLFGRRPVQPELVLYGDVDLRQVELAFDDSERIASVLVQEGDRVKRGPSPADSASRSSVSPLPSITGCRRRVST